MAPKKQPTGYIKLQIPAQRCNPAPPVGPALGQHGVNIPQFVKAFNAASAHLEAGLVTPVVISVYKDRSFSFELKSPPVPVLLLKAAGLKKGSGEPNKSKVGTVTLAQVEEIAKIKLGDLNTDDVQKAMKSVQGTARSMGINVEG